MSVNSPISSQMASILGRACQFTSRRDGSAFSNPRLSRQPIGRDAALRRPCLRAEGGLFSGSGCRAATTPPRAAAERLARAARFAGSLCAAARGATRRSATSSTTLNRSFGHSRSPVVVPRCAHLRRQAKNSLSVLSVRAQIPSIHDCPRTLCRPCCARNFR